MLQRGGYVPSRPSTTSPGRPQALPGRICFSCPGCSASTEMSVRHQPKRLFGFPRNRCTTSSEIAVRHTPKWLFVFRRDTQPVLAHVSAVSQPCVRCVREPCPAPFLCSAQRPLPCLEPRCTSPTPSSLARY